MKLFRSSYEIAACTQAAIVMSFPRRTAREGIPEPQTVFILNQRLTMQGICTKQKALTDDQ